MKWWREDITFWLVSNIPVPAPHLSRERHVCWRMVVVGDIVARFAPFSMLKSHRVLVDGAPFDWALHLWVYDVDGQTNYQKRRTTNHLQMTCWLSGNGQVRLLCKPWSDAVQPIERGRLKKVIVTGWVDGAAPGMKQDSVLEPIGDSGRTTNDPIIHHSFPFFFSRLFLYFFFHLAHGGYKSQSLFLGVWRGCRCKVNVGAKDGYKDLTSNHFQILPLILSLCRSATTQDVPSNLWSITFIFVESSSRKHFNSFK